MTNSSSSATPTPGSTSSNNSATLDALHQQQQQQHQQHQLQQQLQQLHTNAANNSRPPSRAPSILDSPTLARVERARLRLEQQERERERERSSQREVGGGSGGGGGGGGSSTGTGSTATTMNREDSLERSILDPKVSLQQTLHKKQKKNNLNWSQIKKSSQKFLKKFKETKQINYFFRCTLPHTRRI